MPTEDAGRQPAGLPAAQLPSPLSNGHHDLCSMGTCWPIHKLSTHWEPQNTSHSSHDYSFSSMWHPIFPVLSHFRTRTFWHHRSCKLMPHCVKHTHTHKSMIASFFLSGSTLKAIPGTDGSGLPPSPAVVWPLWEVQHCCEESGHVMHSLGGLCEGPVAAATPTELSSFPPFPCAVGQLFPQAWDWGAGSSTEKWNFTLPHTSAGVEPAWISVVWCGTSPEKSEVMSGWQIHWWPMLGARWRISTIVIAAPGWLQEPFWPSWPPLPTPMLFELTSVGNHEGKKCFLCSPACLWLTASTSCLRQGPAHAATEVCFHFCLLPAAKNVRASSVV